MGFLLRTPPRLQYAAQLIGTLIATLVAPSVFVLFTTAYPCIIANPSTEGSEGDAARECPFPGPAVAAWRAVAVVASAPTPSIPPSSARFSAGLALASVFLVLVRRFVFVGQWQQCQRYMPNMMMFALAFTLPSPQTSISMMMGAVAAQVWRWKAPVGFREARVCRCGWAGGGRRHWGDDELCVGDFGGWGTAVVAWDRLSCWSVLRRVVLSIDLGHKTSARCRRWTFVQYRPGRLNKMSMGTWILYH